MIQRKMDGCGSIATGVSEIIIAIECNKDKGIERIRDSARCPVSNSTGVRKRCGVAVWRQTSGRAFRRSSPCVCAAPQDQTTNDLREHDFANHDVAFMQRIVALHSKPRSSNALTSHVPFDGSDV
jgi:hypothetical protein